MCRESQKLTQDTLRLSSQCKGDLFTPEGERVETRGEIEEEREREEEGTSERGENG